jgi:predicted enzyme related to lactoylglutathione lyase
MNSNPVGWFEIYIQDVDRAIKFYESVFECELQELKTPLPGRRLFAFPMEQAQNGASGALVKMDGFPSGGNSTIVYFNCEDCSVEESRVRQSGGRVQFPKMAIGEYGFISLVFDTEGNMIGLHSMQ